MKVTLDTNCLLDYELGNEAAGDVSKLLTAHDAHELDVQVAAIVASERVPGGEFAPNIAAFLKRVEALSTREITVLKPIGGYDITYNDWALLADDAMVDLEQKIHDVLFPTQEFRWVDQAGRAAVDPSQAAETNHREWQKWRNRKCDVAALWCHIFHGGDAFVTSDRNFHKQTKRPRLIDLGAGDIGSPSQSVARLEL